MGLSIHDVGMDHVTRLWQRGGLPPAFTAGSEQKSLRWREQYISTFLERDIPQLGINVPARTLHRFWKMLAHYHGQILNYSELSRSFGTSDMTVRRYIEILEGTFMIRTFQPWHANLGKRIVKKPKLYFSDSGLFHFLMSIDNHGELTAHPKLGASWEGFAMDCVCRSVKKRDDEFFFFATHTGAELDLFWQDSGQNWGVEFKYGDAPKLTRSMSTVQNDLNLSHLWVVYPGDQSYRLKENISVIPLTDIGERWQYYL
jgi:predicted AAA+ superfamily ATPase